MATISRITADPRYRQVLVFDRHPTSMSEIEFFQWEVRAQPSGNLPSATKR